MAKREEAIELILNTLEEGDLVIACNGKIGRELYELRVKREEENNDFILVGAMGRALGVALGVANNTLKKVVCLVGDGNFIMGMSSLATYMKMTPPNLFVYILNNDAHDSTGGQATAFSSMRHLVPSRYNFRIIDVERGAREDLGRPTISAGEMTKRFNRKCLSSL